MGEFEAKVLVEAPADKVWEFITDPGTMHLWEPLRQPVAVGYPAGTATDDDHRTSGTSKPATPALPTALTRPTAPINAARGPGDRTRPQPERAGPSSAASSTVVPGPARN